MRQTLSDWESRIAEMQKSRGSEQKALRQLESQYKDQLTERNSLLATLWQRLGGIVGSKWVDKVNAQGGGGDVAPSTNFAGFSRNILQCVKVLEDVMVNFKLKCKGVERDLWNDYKYLPSVCRTDVLGISMPRWKIGRSGYSDWKPCYVIAVKGILN